MLWRWWHMEEQNRPRVWLLYGWFSGLMCLGSVFGAVTWGAWMQFLVLLYTKVSSSDLGVKQATFALAQRWRAVFFVTYAIAFLCMSAAKLMVLDRLSDFAVPKTDGMFKRIAVGGRVVMVAVVVGNFVGLCGNVAAAVDFKESADLLSAAASAFTAKDVDSYNTVYNRAIQKSEQASNAASVQQFFEVTVLLIIILAFAVVGVISARRVNSALRNMNDEQRHGASARQLRRQIVGTAAFVFVTFLLRAAFSIMYALANAFQNNHATSACNFMCDPVCYNFYALMQNWIQYTPEFQLTIELISSPLALLVALWGMTSKRALQLMRSSRKPEVAIGDVMELRHAK